MLNALFVFVCSEARSWLSAELVECGKLFCGAGAVDINFDSDYMASAHFIFFLTTSKNELLPIV